VDSIRPSGGLHIRYADDVNGKKALRDLPAGTPLAWDMIESKSA
jgi:sialic acid synthase SpsE